MTMPCHTRMKSTFLQGLLWLLLLQLGFMAVSLEPGYLDFDNLPDTNFSCIGRVVGGYYADIATTCQMFHVCTLGQNNETMDIRFLCLNGTVFEQSTRVCERIDEVDCEKSEQYYHLNNELYGGMDPLIIRGETEPLEPPPKPSTTTTTSTAASTPTTPNPYFGTTKQTTSHQNIPVHYTSDSPADIRFDPKIINLQLNSDPSLGVNIKPVSYQQQSYDDKSHHTIVTTHSYKSDIPKTIYDGHSGQNLKTTDINYEFEYQDQQEQYSNQANKKNYQSVPSYSPSAAELDDYSYDVYKGSTYRTVYHTPSSKSSDSSTYKTPITFTQSSNPQYSFSRTEVPVKQQQNLQVTAPPSIYSALSSPAPFTHSHHLEAKRNTDHHKIKKSFSLSISDQNGRELIKVNNTPISAIFPDSYLDYKDEDATLLPIFEDVPRLEKRRPKRNTEDNKRVFKADPEAADVLKFLVDWYTNYEKTTKVSVPLTSEAITQINDELSIGKETSENDVKEEIVDKENNNETVSDLQKRENEYYDDDEYYYDVEDYTELEANKSSSNITVSHKELELNIDNKHAELKNQTNSTKIGDENSKNLTYNYLDEYVDDNYEPETYNANNSNTMLDSNRTETDKNDIPREVITTPIEYDYIDDNYESLSPDNNSESTKNITLENVVKESTTVTSSTSANITSTTITPITTPASSTTNKIEAEFNEILTTDLTLSGITEDSSKIADTSEHVTMADFSIPLENATDASYSNELDENHKELNISKDGAIIPVNNQTTDEIHLEESIEHIHEDIGITTEIIDENLELEQTTHDIMQPEQEYITTISTTTEPTMTTAGSLPTTTLHYHSQLPTEQTTAVTPDDSHAATETILTTSSVSYKPADTPTEVPIVTSSYPATEVSEQILETTYLSERIHTTTTAETPVVIVKENLGDMIKDIEIETKSVAATIVMPQAKETLSSTSDMPKLENTASTESVEPVTSVPISVTTTSEVVTTISQVSTSITTPKLIETTRLHFGRGRHTYFTRKTTTTSRPSHRFNLQQPRRRFDTHRSRGRFGTITDQKTLNHSVKDVNTILVKYNSSTTTTTTTIKNDFSITDDNSTNIDNNQTTPIPQKTSYEKKIVSLHKTEAITDASLSKSANPTLAKETRNFLATTPISKHIRVKFKKERVNKKYMFTCFDKNINKFYSDPRDCRLFHYCSPGYTSNQLVDMKFVCDLGTYFDDAKLICTEKKPARCL